MRTTVDLDIHLLREAKQRAASRGVTLSSVMEEALREMLARYADGPPSAPVTLTTDPGGGGLRPDVDLDNNAATLELMESADDPV